MTVTINHLRSLSALYPRLQMEIRAQNFRGEFWHDGPCLGFVVDGEFITTREALALDAMAPVDAMLLECINHENSPVGDAIAHEDIDDALRSVMDQCGIDSGDVAGLFFTSMQSGPNPQGRWFDMTLAERRALLLDWLAFESAHLDNAARLQWHRADAQQNA